MRSEIFIASMFFAVLSGRSVIAQQQAVVSMRVMGGGAGAGMVTAHSEDMEVEPAKGSPFCATIVTEHTQAFADGNRIHTSDNASLCRDAEGRTRREASLNLLGAAPQAPTPKLITIVDPVAGFRYMLDTESKTAHKIPIGPPPGIAGIKGPMAGIAEKGEVMLYQHVGTAGPNMTVGGDVFFKRTGQGPNEPAPSTESLGDQSIDGIHATGTRITTTVPAGKMGNEEPILITSERWYSPELKATVMSKHTDPWAGELKTQFTNVNSSEPDPSLFQVPSDYKVLDEKAGPFIIQKRVPALLPPPQ